MKIKQLAAGALFLALTAVVTQADPLGTAFTYQGHLSSGPNAATGVYDFRFALFDTASGGNAVAGPLTNGPVGVTNGLFTTTLDFGSGVFDGSARWLEIAVRATGSGMFTPLVPRQPLTPSPYALHSANASTASSVPAVNLTGTLADARLSTNVALRNASQVFTGSNRFAGPVVATGAGSQFAGSFVGDGSGLGGVWSLAGNAGTDPGTQFLGTTDDQALEIHVNARRALRLEPNPDGPNVIGGSANNSVGAGNYAATIAGGVNNSSWGAYTFIGGGWNNSARNESTVVCGGEANTLYSGTWGALVGGQENWMELAVWSFLGGGHANEMVNAYRSVIGGGEGNRLYGYADANFIGSGLANSMRGPNTGCAIVGGSHNQIGDGSPGSLTGMTIGGGRYNQVGWVWDEMHDSVIGGGFENVMRASRSTISGGLGNEITLPMEAGAAPYTTASTIGGGSWNLIQSAVATIAGGSQNAVSTNSDGSTIGGGVSNQIPAQAFCATIPGGWGNTATNSAFAAGTRAQAVHTGAFVWGDATDGDIASTTANQFVARASGGARFYSDTNASIGVELAAGANAWSVLSDRNLKDGFRPVDARAVLEQVTRLPITEWHLKAQSPSVRHLGPMAQDFAAAFRLGEDDRHISTSDADGVAFAAIQGLNQKLEESIRTRDAEIESLKATVTELKQMLRRLATEQKGTEP